MLKAEYWSVIFPARMSPEHMKVLDWLAILSPMETKDLTASDIS